MTLTFKLKSPTFPQQLISYPVSLQCYNPYPMASIFGDMVVQVDLQCGFELSSFVPNG